MRRVFLAFAVALSTVHCTEPVESETGTIIVAVRTTGGDPDNSYLVRVNDDLVPVGGTLAVYIFREPGSYSVGLQGIAGNCLLAGANPRQVELAVRGRIDVVFEVDCAATGFEVNVTTEGSDTPPNFLLNVDENSVEALQVNGLTRFTRRGIGEHTLFLQFPGENCVHAGPDHAVITVLNREVTRVSFAVRCQAPVRRERIAFVSDTVLFSEPVGKVSVVNPDGSQLRRLVRGQSPSWSPDGTSLVYSTIYCDFYYGCSGGLEILDPEVMRGSSLVNGYNAVRPRWSPAGDLIAFVDFKNQVLHLISPRNPADHRTLAVEGVSRIRDAAWSPDGQRIVASCVITFANYDICVFKRDASGLAVLTTSASIDFEPEWSPDGGSITFTTTPFAGSGTRIAVMDADGSNQRDLTSGSSPSWSRDGSRIIFARSDGLYTMNRDGSDVRRVTSGSDYAAAWRP